MPRYRYVIEEDAVTTLLALDDADILGLVAAIEELAEEPGAQADGYSLDAHGRPLANRIAGRFLIGYWPEHQARKVHILRIDPLEND